MPGSGSEGPGSGCEPDLERAEREGTVDLFRAAPGYVASELGVRLEETGERVSWAVSALSGDRVFNRVMGLGRDRVPTDAELDSVARFFADAGVRYTVAVAPGPLADDLAGRLFERGFMPTYAWMKFRRGLEAPGDVSTDLSISEVGVEHAEAFGRVIMGSFGLPPAFEDWIAALVGRPGWRCFLAFAGDRPAAAGALYLAGESGWLALGGTLPEFRRRGAQNAILAARLEAAAEAGCAFVVTETGEQVEGRPSHSYRNIVRAGFEPAYVRPNYLSPS